MAGKFTPAFFDFQGAKKDQKGQKKGKKDPNFSDFFRAPIASEGLNKRFFRKFPKPLNFCDKTCT